MQIEPGMTYLAIAEEREKNEAAANKEREKAASANNQAADIAEMLGEEHAAALEKQLTAEAQQERSGYADPILTAELQPAVVRGLADIESSGRFRSDGGWQASPNQAQGAELSNSAGAEMD